MKSRPLCRVAALIGLCLAVPAWATAVAGADGTSAQGRRVVFATPSQGAAVAQTLELTLGQIDDVNLGKREVTIAGKTVALHPTQLRVVGPGGRGEPGASALRKGMSVRFALDPVSKAVERPIVLIYIDRP